MQQLADRISIALAQGELWGQLEEVVAERTAELQAANANLQQEIVERQQVEIALRRSEEQLRSITNALPVLIAYVDDRECYQFNNQAYTDWLGKSLTSIHGSPMRQVWGFELLTISIFKPNFNLSSG
jgi:two-component system, OmpR family, sensor histidine kinase VicK